MADGRAGAQLGISMPYHTSRACCLGVWSWGDDPLLQNPPRGHTELFFTQHHVLTSSCSQGTPCCRAQPLREALCFKQTTLQVSSSFLQKKNNSFVGRGLLCLFDLKQNVSRCRWPRLQVYETPACPLLIPGSGGGLLSFGFNSATFPVAKQR